MAERPSKRPRISRGDDYYYPGTIVEIEIHNFMTFNSLKCEAGPRLNLGPNGSGKDSLVCAIALGLGGEPQLLGRATSIGAYVKRGEESGYIKISAIRDTNGHKLVIMRKIDIRDKSEWLFNGRVVPKEKILEIVRRFNIQVNKLTQAGTYLDQMEKDIKHSDFVNKESIPSMVDGLKPCQRMILFGLFKSNLVKIVEVISVVNRVHQHSANYPSMTSCVGTIISMAQDFVGSNNVNLLKPKSWFGSRHQGGKVHGECLHSFTQLSPITRYLFPKDDDIVLDYLNEDGESVEPTWYMPIIPTVLINESKGIGRGWSSYFPKYNPMDIIANVRRLLNGEPMKPMDPWYRGFKGSIEKTTTKKAGVSYTITGIIEEVNETTLKITELPVGRWTETYKVFLESIMTGNEKNKDPFIKDYRDHSCLDFVHFEVTLSEESMMMAKKEGLLKKFKLTTTISTSNRHLFDSRGVIKKYDSPEQILEEFFHLRLDYYEKRKRAVLENLETELLKLDNKVRYILEIAERKILLVVKTGETAQLRTAADQILELKQKGFTPFPKKTKVEETDIASDYNYLFSMIFATSFEDMQELCDDMDRLNDEIDELRRTTPKALWAKDLDALEKQLEQERLDEEAEVAARMERRNEAMSKQRQEQQLQNLNV